MVAALSVTLQHGLRQLSCHVIDLVAQHHRDGAIYQRQVAIIDRAVTNQRHLTLRLLTQRLNDPFNAAARRVD